MECDGCKEEFEESNLEVFTNPKGLGWSTLCKECSSNTGSGKQ